MGTQHLVHRRGALEIGQTGPQHLPDHDRVPGGIAVLGNYGGLMPGAMLPDEAGNLLRTGSGLVGVTSRRPTGD